MLRNLPVGAKNVFVSPFFRGLHHKTTSWKKNSIDAIQEKALRKNLGVIEGSDFDHQNGLTNTSGLSVKNFQNEIPVFSYETISSFVNATMDGKTQSLFHRKHAPSFYAMTSGTTGSPKFIPVTSDHTQILKQLTTLFACSLFMDQPHLVFKPLAHLRSSAHVQKTFSGQWCGDMSGFIASVQPWVVRQYALLPDFLCDIKDQQKKWILTLLRLLVEKDLSVIISASPASLVLLCEIMSQQGLILIEQLKTHCDLFDLGLSVAEHHWMNRNIIERISFTRWKELRDAALSTEGLLPSKIWRSLEMIACWNGISFSHFIPQIRRNFGSAIQIRDIGLFASEGFLMSPLLPNSQLYVPHMDDYFFEFVPINAAKSAKPLLLSQVSQNESYHLILTNPSGLIRYQLGDIVKCSDFEGQLPLFEFCGRDSQICDLTGEKLSAQQCAQAWYDFSQTEVFKTLKLNGLCSAYVVIGREKPIPYYELVVDLDSHISIKESPLEKIAERFDQLLQKQNFIFREHRESGKLEKTRIHLSYDRQATKIYEQQLQQRSRHLEQFKPTCLVRTQLG